MTRLLNRHVAIGLALVLVGLSTRALIDKLLALGADWSVVARWAQLQTMLDLPAAIALAGVGQGLTVYAARRADPPDRLIRDALVWGLVASGAMSLVALAAMPWLNEWAGREIAPTPQLGALAVLAGFVSVAPGLFSCFWQGRAERGKMLALALAGAAPLALAAAGAFGTPTLERLLWSQILGQCAIAIVLVLWRRDLFRIEGGWRGSRLAAYIPAGLSIGLLSPISILWSRAELAKHLSWNEVAQLQALWRTDDWITNIAGAALGLVFFPRMAAAAAEGRIRQEFMVALRMIALPTFAAAFVLWLTQGAIIPFLYSEQFLMPALASALFLAGDALRVASWVGLQGLFASEQVKAAAIGEWLSLPLFAFLLTVVAPRSLTVACACYAATYVVYFGFNFYFVMRAPARRAGGDGAWRERPRSDEAA